MKILYVHQYFKTPEEGGGIRSYYLAKGLVDHGYEVEMITAHNEKEYANKKIAGINVHYLPVFYDNRLGFLRRIYAFLNFVLKACLHIKTIKNIDLCYTMSTPLTTGLIALFVKKRHHIPYYFEVGDLWPEAPIQMGAIKNYLIKKWLYQLEKIIYHKADKLIALSPDIRDAMIKTSGEKRIPVIPNMADCNFFSKAAKVLELESYYSVPNQFVVTYMGAVGKANHLEYLIAGAEFCKAQGLPIRFLVVGQGSELGRIKGLALEQALNNITFLPHQSKEGLRQILNITDAVYISYANKPVLQTGSPNKFFDGLAAGKAIITNTEGWIKELITSRECGFYHNPEQPRELVENLKPYLEKPRLLLNHQKNARDLAEYRFSRELQVQNLLRVLDKNHQHKVKEPQVYTMTA